MNIKLMGIEIGGTKLQIVIGDIDCNILRKANFVIDPSRGAEGIKTSISHCFEEWAEEIESVIAIGIGFGGPVDWTTGEIKISHQIQGWNGFNIKSWLQETVNKSVFVDNDANVAALGESIHGAGIGFGQVFYMTIGSGIGGGVVLNNRIYHGKMPGEVEIGHLRLDKLGTTLESKCSGWAINKRIRTLADKNKDSILSDLISDSKLPESYALKSAIAQHDPIAIEIVSEVSQDIAFCLSHVVHLFHPEIIIIGGGISLLGDIIRIPIEDALSGYIMKTFLPAPSIMVSDLGEMVVPVGALELAKQSVYN